MEKQEKSINQLYTVDLLKVVFKIDNPKINIHDLVKKYSPSSNKVINDFRFKNVYQNDQYNIAYNDELFLLQFKNITLVQHDFTEIIKNLKCEFDLGPVESIYIDIALDTDSNIYELFEETRKNPNYKYEKKIKVSKDDQELYDLITIGSRSNFFFRLYDKSKEIIQSKKIYIQNLHDHYFNKSSPIYRLELSLKPSHCKSINLDLYKLNNDEYLKAIFKTYFEKRLMFRVIDKNDKNRSRWEKIYLFDINGEKCIERSHSFGPINISTISIEGNKKTTCLNYVKGVIRSLYNFYMIDKNPNYLVTIRDICINYDLQNFILSKIKDNILIQMIDEEMFKSKEEFNIHNIDNIFNNN